MNKLFLKLLLIIALNTARAQCQTVKEKEIDHILSELTLEEKENLLHGFTTEKRGPERFYSGGIERLGIPPIKMLDGPLGARDYSYKKKFTTALPSTISLSCSWDTSAVKTYAGVIAREMLALKRQVLLGPGMNLMRSPLGGRNFEYMGEDPFLTGILSSVYIKELQRNRIAASAKHFVANNIDRFRFFTSSNMDDITLRNIYIYPFELAIRKANPWTLMVGNNLVNGKHVAENKKLLTDILRKNIHYDGVILTDWRAAYEAEPSIKAGLDITMGHCGYVYGRGNLVRAVKTSRISEKLLDDHVRNVLRLYQRTGLLERGYLEKSRGEINSPKHKEIARRIASEGMVLLKNRNILPLQPNKVDKIVVTGPALESVAVGTGSSWVPSEFSITPYQGLQEVFSEDQLIKVDKDEDIKAVGKQINTKTPILFFAHGPKSGEGGDLEGLALPHKQKEKIEQWAEKFKVIVVLQSASAVDFTDWNDDVDAILCAWYGGQATGQAIADVLTGKVNPGGKLSFTIAEHLEDYAPHALKAWPQYPVIDRAPTTASFDPEKRKAVHGYSIDYKERILMGYRWFDTKKITPLYEFGYGLSYTGFSIQDVRVQPTSSDPESPVFTIDGNIKNTGPYEGKEVLQVYLGHNDKKEVTPEKALKAFDKIELKPGMQKDFAFKLDKSAFSHWDANEKNWVVSSGIYTIYIGTSSKDIIKKVKIKIE